MALPSGPVEVELRLGDLETPDGLGRALARRLRVPLDELPAFHLRRRSLDARRGRIVLHCLVELGAPSEAAGIERPLREVRGQPPVVIVGAGPAGLFCAHELARAGIASVVLDRGKHVQPRRHDLKALHQRGVVDPESNYCFGEGGAGTYSDGKLYTRAHKRGDVSDVLQVLASHGAPEDILIDARPHVGSNRLPKVVTALRARLEAVGVVFRFGAKLSELCIRHAGTSDATLVGVELADGTRLEASGVVLATGHSASDVLELLRRRGVGLEPKAFAMGVRVEHPQTLIDRVQYGGAAGHPALPAAAYSLTCTVEARGVFSFCMCPGGFIVPASTEPGHLVVNGMSLTRRRGRQASAGLVVAIAPEDLGPAAARDALAGIALQRRLERVAFEAGGGELRAPATRVSDFVAGRGSSTVPESSYVPGLTPTDLGSVLDASGLRLAALLRAALRQADRSLRGFVTDEAVVVGVESRTSSPVRVPRDPETLEARGLRGLYPCGEGAGYAGGIVSAALDGVRVAQRLAQRAG